MLEVYFKDAATTIRFSVKRTHGTTCTINLETGPLSNGELGWFLRIITHPRAADLINGQIRSPEATFPDSVVEQLRGKILSKEIY